MLSWVTSAEAPCAEAAKTTLWQEFITGSADGLGMAAARTLIDEGHEVILHARNDVRPASLSEACRSVGVVVGDLQNAAEGRALANQVNAIGRMDAVIHNAGCLPSASPGLYRRRSRRDARNQHAGPLHANCFARACRHIAGVRGQISC